MPAPVRYQIGSIDVVVISDGSLWMDAGAAFGLIPRPMWEPYVADVIDEQHRIRAALNCLLLRSAGQTLLIETGVGGKDPTRPDRGPDGYGRLLPELAALGVRPEDVDIVINTHLHFDHCGGNTVRTGSGEAVPAFPNARYLIRRGEWEAATHPNERTRGTYFAENFVPLQASGRLELYDGEYDVTDEVRLVDTPGHTANHAAVAIASGGARAVYLGDAIHHTVQLERLAWIPAFDVLPLVSLDTKRRLVEEAIERRDLLITTHHVFPGAGVMEQEGRRRHWRDVPPDALAQPLAEDAS